MLRTLNLSLSNPKKRSKRPKTSKTRLQQDAKRDWGRWQSNCRRKTLYRTQEEAQERADRFNDRITLTYTPLVIYRCHRHDGWHVGHSS